jgi:polysaccharide export outer membrane protein
MFNRVSNRVAGPCLLGLLVLILAACQKTPPPQSSNETGPPPIYTLGPGDKVRIIVFQQENLSGTFEVDSTGRLALPLVRGVDAKGLTIPGLEELITQQLIEERFLNPRVSVDLIKTRPVCVFGEVNKPGCFDYVYGMRAAAAIAMAGGYTYRALQDSVQVMRSDGDKIAGSHDTLLFPGDVIEIDERFF